MGTSERFHLQADQQSQEAIQKQRDKFDTLPSKEQDRQSGIVEEEAREVNKKVARGVDTLMVKKNILEAMKRRISLGKPEDFQTIDYNGVLETLSEEIEEVSHKIDHVVSAVIEKMDSEKSKLVTQCLVDLKIITECLPDRPLPSPMPPVVKRDFSATTELNKILTPLPLTDAYLKTYSEILNQPIVQTPMGDAIKLGEIEQMPVLFFRSGVIDMGKVEWLQPTPEESKP